MSWIRLDRSLFDHSVFAEEPFTEREAFIWLIMNVAWKDTRHRIGLNIVHVARGSMFTTLESLRSEWCWNSVKKVRNFLDLLEFEQMIVRKKGTKKTHLTICNYEKYQDNKEKKGTEKAQDRDSTGHEKGTEKAQERHAKGTNIQGLQELEEHSLRSCLSENEISDHPNLGKPENPVDGNLAEEKPPRPKPNLVGTDQESLALDATPPPSSHPPPAKPKRARKAYPELFEVFWREYPTDPNMSKAEAGKAWEKLSDEDQNSAIAALPKFLEYCRGSPDYRPVHACRFLSQRRFEGFNDEAKQHYQPSNQAGNSHATNHDPVADEIAKQFGDWRNSEPAFSPIQGGDEQGRSGEHHRDLPELTGRLPH